MTETDKPAPLGGSELSEGLELTAQDIAGLPDEVLRELRLNGRRGGNWGAQGQWKTSNTEHAPRARKLSL